ncbi:serine protease [Actinoplanes cyaneus]|uniref:Serine protease n=1 Tax=Actinoplanes cyaneus TaxID=52696 RepID=A0A919M4F6_9ACTN|nr:S53 family peptidase [Actinoplanes cyaneus]MCW2142316.1 Subtilase family protein [Actinoplanes cyaneus]GID69335.1 serine protease [Actinoplanes cyaneus]
MLIPSTLRYRVTAVVALGAAVVSVLGATPASASRPGRHTLGGSKPRWIGQAKDAGTPAPVGTVQFGLLLTMRDQAGAEARLAALSDPDSASYGQYLNNAQFTAAYAPSAADVRSVTSWLTGQGLRVRDTLAGGLYVEASGTVAQIDKTFGTTVRRYTYEGKTVTANSTDLSLPSDAPAVVTGLVNAVVGIDQGSLLKKPADTLPPPSDGFRAGTPCSSYYGEKVATTLPAAPDGKKKPYVVCGYTPKQYQSAYGVTEQLKRGLDGRGVTVAVTDAYASPTIARDVRTYSRKYGLPALEPGQFSQITPPADGYTDTELCDASGWYGEETLDIEAVHTMAPGARIVYVGAPNCLAGLDEAWAQTIDDHVADIVTNSWGSGTDDVELLGAETVKFYQLFSLKAALTGITVDFSSGDAGDQTSGGTDLPSKSVSFPSDLPFVTAVGGTSVGIDKRGNRVWEHGWQNAYQTLTDGAWGPSAYTSGGGGGTSILFPQPFYQRGKVPSSISKYFSATPARTTPDISMPGDPNTGFRVGQTQTFPDGVHYDEYRIGGTSLASPLLAGMQAIANQKARHPLGFVNPLYYRELGTSALHDVTAPSTPLYEARTNFVNGIDASGGLSYILRQVDVQTTTIHSTPGYDAETGVGVPGEKFFSAVPGRR